MTRVPRNAKTAKMIKYKPKAKKELTVVLAPTKTRRGKVIYAEVDAASYCGISKKGDKSPKKPSASTSGSMTAAPASLDNTSQESSCLNEPEPHIPRITKVRLTLVNCNM
jgi:hypothetical protein